MAKLKENEPQKLLLRLNWIETDYKFVMATNQIIIKKQTK